MVVDSCLEEERAARIIEARRASPMVTISRQAGAGGDEIARLLAEELDWKLLDNDVVEKLLVEKGFPRAEAVNFEEKQPGLWHRFSSEKDKYLHFLKMVSYEFARQANCIILGRGGQIMFADVPGVIRVRVIAPLQDRIAKLRETSGEDERRTRQAVQHSDNERTAFHRFLFHANWDSPDLYDLIINTHDISPKTATALVVKALSAKEMTGKKREASHRLENLYLAQKAIVTVLFEQKLPIRCLEIERDDGAITLKGTARDRPSIERCGETAARVCDVTKVNNEIRFDPQYVELLGGIQHGAAERMTG
jgi:cytidylate kinase